MQLARIDQAEHATPEHGGLARPLLDGGQSTTRLIRLDPGQSLPAHRHGRSD
jgi:quercetin dioxygenase-like cupin family protein